MRAGVDGILADVDVRRREGVRSWCGDVCGRGGEDVEARGAGVCAAASDRRAGHVRLFAVEISKGDQSTDCAIQNKRMIRTLVPVKSTLRTPSSSFSACGMSLTL